MAQCQWIVHSVCISIKCQYFSLLSRLWKPSCQKKHLGNNILEHNYAARDDLQHSSHTCQLCLTEGHNWLHFSQHGRLFILNSVYKPLEGGAPSYFPIILMSSTYRTQTIHGSVLDLPPIEEQKQYHFWKNSQNFIKPCRPSSPYTFVLVILHKLKHFSTSNMFCQVVFSWLSFSTAACSANSEPCLNIPEVTF